MHEASFRSPRGMEVFSDLGASLVFELGRPAIDNLRLPWMFCVPGGAVVLMNKEDESFSKSARWKFPPCFALRRQLACHSVLACGCPSFACGGCVTQLIDMD